MRPSVLSVSLRQCFDAMTIEGFHRIVPKFFGIIVRTNCRTSSFVEADTFQKESNWSIFLSSIFGGSLNRCYGLRCSAPAPLRLR